MVCEDVLKVKNLPKELTDLEKEDLLKHFGATKIKVLTSKGRQRSVAFARFDSKEIAREVLFRLHQTYVLKNRLCVEYADHDVGLPKITKVEQTNNNKEYLKTFITKLNSFNHSVDFQQPPPSHLKYVYPKANRPTINNIGHALATVPRFYKQVLHLMNRMNLPPPFAVPEPMRQNVTSQVQPKNVNTQQTKSQESSSESELESDEDAKQNMEIIPQKRVFPQKKTVKRRKFIKPTNTSTPSNTKHEKTEDVFEKTVVQQQRKINVKVSASAVEEKLHIEVKEIGVIKSSISESEDHSVDCKSDKSAISLQELSTNQIPEKDLDVLPVFKKYHPGVPTCRLYVKNIAKGVELKDLEYIYNRYKTVNSEEKQDNFDIRLMQEGRMKGQAFITLNSVEVAHQALKETNAYILKDKPLVVVFARLAPPKK